MRIINLAMAVVALGLSGCAAYTDISKYNGPVRTDDGEKAIGSIEISCVGYKLFSCIPLVSGEVWTEDAVPYDKDGRNGKSSWFNDKCDIDENMKGLKRALKEFPSNRVCNLTTYDDTWNWWSLFVIRRRIIRTTCTVLEKK